MVKSIRWTEEELAAFESRGTKPLEINRLPPAMKEALKSEFANSVKLPIQAVPAPTGTQKMQALGRQRDGKMNKTEARYAEHLAAEAHAGRVLWWAFEAIKLKLADNTHLTVDFAVMRADGTLAMHDVKGARAIYAEDAKVKMKVAARLFPFAFYVVYPNKTTGGWDIEEV